MKRLAKRFLLRKRGILCDRTSNVNWNVKKTGELPSYIIRSNMSLSSLGQGCFIENTTGFGMIELADFVSVTGPGTILHAEIGKIIISSFCSIAANVSIQEFNHDASLPTTYAIQYNLFGNDIKKDLVSKGDILLEEDVWIGSNAVILSGVRIGRGSIIGAGSIVTKSVPAYSIIAGNPGRVIKMRFDEETILRLEASKWWTWPIDKIKQYQDFFATPVTNCRFGDYTEKSR